MSHLKAAYPKTDATRDEGRGEIFNFIEMFYNPVKRHGYLRDVVYVRFGMGGFSSLEGG